MGNYNKVLLMGNLTRDPELRYTPAGTAVATFGLAVNRRWRRQDGEQGEETCFVDITAFGRQAEVVSEYLSKGRPVFVEGRLRLDNWETPDGQKRSRHTVTLENFQFIDSRGQATQQPPGAQRSQRPQPAAGPPGQQAAPPGRPAPGPAAGGLADDDIPF